MQPKAALSIALQLREENLILCSMAFCRKMVIWELEMSVWQNINSKESSNSKLEVNAGQLLPILLHRGLAFDIWGISRNKQSCIFQLEASFPSKSTGKEMEQSVFSSSLTSLN